MTSSPETPLRRTPYPSVKKRNQNNPHYRSGVGLSSSLQQQQQQSPLRRPRIFDENDLRSTTHTVVYDSSKSIPIRRGIIPPEDQTVTVSSFGGSGNESDYDNHHSNTENSKVTRYLTTTTRFFRIPVHNFNRFDEITHTDDLLLGDQNEIILNNDSTIHSTTNNGDGNDDADVENDYDEDDDKERTEARVELSDDHDDDIDADENTIQSTIVNNNNPSSDNNTLLSTNSRQPSSNHRSNTLTIMKPTKPTALDDSAPSKYVGFPKDPLTARKLLDIRSHLLLNTTLDAT